MEVLEVLQVKRTGVELHRTPESQAVTESMPVHYGTLSILCDITVNLLLGLLSRELQIGPEEVLRLNPRTRYSIDADIIQEE